MTANDRWICVIDLPDLVLHVNGDLCKEWSPAQKPTLTRFGTEAWVLSTAAARATDS